MSRSRNFLFGLAMCFLTPHIQAQSEAKSLFIGLSQNTKRVAPVMGNPGPARPVRPKVLGLQTTIYQLSADGGAKMVSPSTIFVGGSQIRLGFNANRAGFLYVVNLGSSGNITTIFPVAATDNNQVQPGVMHQIPQQAGKSIKFDTTPGEEVLLVVLSESRISDFQYGGQRIDIFPHGMNPGTAGGGQQRIVMASLDLASTSKDLFVEDDGMFRTVVFNPASEVSSKKNPLVMAIKLAHR